MKIVKISGGLGNQMFQYALVLSLRNKGNIVKLDISKYKYLKAHNNYELDRVFGISEKFASEKEVKKLGYLKENGIYRFLLNSRFRKKSYFRERNMKYDSNVFDMDSKYLSGYWQNERYFKHIKDKIIEVYNLDQINDKNYEYWKDKIERSQNSVSVHIRRGDYINHPLYKGICDLEYYINSIEFLKKEIKGEIEIFFFSNDIEWVKENFNYNNMNFVEGNTKEKSFIDMKLMTLCKNNIIANSSFSWWGAWLNKNDYKIVVAPNKWLNNDELVIEDIIPESWIRL